MNKITSTIAGIFKFLFDEKRIKIVLIIAVVALAMLLFRSCNEKNRIQREAKREQLIYEQNQRALNDTIRKVKNKAGEIESVKSSFLAKMEDLEKLNRELYEESKKEIGNLKSLIKTQVVVQTEPISVSNDLVRYPDGRTYGLSFENTLADSGMTWKIRGESKFKMTDGIIYPGSTDITENKMSLRLTLGFKETDKNYEVFAKSLSPNVEFDKLDGVMLIPKKNDPILCPPAKKKRFGIGLSAGGGLTSRNGNVMLTPYVGFGINYNIIEF